LLTEIERSKEKSTEPNERSTKFYRSFMIYPILGRMNADPGQRSVGLDNYMQYKKKNVFGLMCVDSARKKAFNLGADADIMKQLTSYAFGAFRIAQVITDLAGQKGLTVETR
jgi:hypothetical protein